MYLSRSLVPISLFALMKIQSCQYGKVQLAGLYCLPCNSSSTWMRCMMTLWRSSTPFRVLHAPYNAFARLLSGVSPLCWQSSSVEPLRMPCSQWWLFLTHDGLLTTTWGHRWPSLSELAFGTTAMKVEKVCAENKLGEEMQDVHTTYCV